MRGFFVPFIMTKPIGVFDSGYGGLTVLKDIRRLLPEYDYLYLGDNARTPYGNRSFNVVYNYTLEAVQHLFNSGCELVILACNTASAKALRNIQQNNLPQISPNKRVLGVIRPSTELIASFTTTDHIGILGTTGTIASNSYPIEIKKFAPNVKVTQQACPMWVPLVENHCFDTPGGHFFIKQALDSILSKDPKIDVLMLACTHYPFLKPLIEKYLPDHIQVIAQGELVSNSLKQYLTRHKELADLCSKNGQINYQTTEQSTIFDQNASKFLDEIILSENIHL